MKIKTILPISIGDLFIMNIAKEESILDPPKITSNHRYYNFLYLHKKKYRILMIL